MISARLATGSAAALSSFRKMTLAAPDAPITAISAGGQARNIKGVAEPDEPGGLVRRVAVQAACQHARVVGDDADCTPAQARQGHHHVAGKMGVGLEELPVVHD